MFIYISHHPEYISSNLNILVNRNYELWIQSHMGKFNIHQIFMPLV